MPYSTVCFRYPESVTLEAILKDSVGIDSRLEQVQRGATDASLSAVIGRDLYIIGLAGIQSGQRLAGTGGATTNGPKCSAVVAVFHLVGDGITVDIGGGTPADRGRTGGDG